MGNVFTRKVPSDGAIATSSSGVVVAPNPPVNFVTREELEKVAASGGPKTSVLFQPNNEVVVMPPEAPRPRTAPPYRPVVDGAAAEYDEPGMTGSPGMTSGGAATKNRRPVSRRKKTGLKKSRTKTPKKEIRRKRSNRTSRK